MDETTKTLEEANNDLRAAVEARLAAKVETVAEPAVPVDWILRGQAELQAARESHVATEAYSELWEPQPARPAAIDVATRTLEQAIAAVHDRNAKYGPPTEHFARTAAMVNAAFGTSFTAADWALVMVLDKVARLRGPTPTADGGVDIAGYGGCYEECRGTAC